MTSLSACSGRALCLVISDANPSAEHARPGERRRGRKTPPPAKPATFPGMFPADDPVVAELLASPTLMRLAYVGAHGQPHVVPIWYRYADGRFTVVTGPKADKVRHISQRPRVSFTIDTDRPPYHVLLVDGVATVEQVEGMAPEYPDIVRRFLGPGADAYLARMEGRVKRQVRITIEPKTWRILDFVKRTPKSLS